MDYEIMIAVSDLENKLNCRFESEHCNLKTIRSV